MTGYIKYNLVGVIGAALNFSALWVLTEKAHLWYLLSATIGIIIAASCNYVLNYLWTFSSRKHQIKSHFQGWARFLASVSVTEGVYLYLVYLFTSTAGLHYMVSAFLSLSLTSVVRYITANKWVWKGEEPLTKLEVLEGNIEK